MSVFESIATRLQAYFEAEQIVADAAPFVMYLKLLHQWNQAYNLTAVREPSAMLSRHILDSLAILPWMRGKRWLDVGTGPGLPGIPLALLAPQETWITLLDSNGKKTRFLREVVRLLGLSNVEVVESRVESYHPSQRFDTVVSRAFSAIEPMIQNTRHLIQPDGLWLAMKGQIPEHELKTINQPYQLETYTVPDVSGARCCVLVESSSQA